MAHTKAGGSTSLGRDSQSKRLGIKKFSGQIAQAGNIVVRQRGTKFISGEGTKMGTDNTIFATIDGIVQFTKKKTTRFTGRLKNIHVVSITESKKS